MICSCNWRIDCLTIEPIGNGAGQIGANSKALAARGRNEIPREVYRLYMLLLLADSSNE